MNVNTPTESVSKVGPAIENVPVPRGWSEVPGKSQRDDGTGNPLRLSLLQHRDGEAATLDGAWWPRSRDLVTEVPALVVELRRRGIRTTRVGYSRKFWDPAPRRLAADRRLIRLGWFQNLDQYLVRLTGGDTGQVRLDLLVIPPGLDEAAASRAMAAASAAENQASATAVLVSIHGQPDSERPEPYGALGRESGGVPAPRSEGSASPRANDTPSEEGTHSRAHTCPGCGSMPLSGGHCECSYASFDARNHSLWGS